MNNLVCAGALALGLTAAAAAAQQDVTYDGKPARVIENDKLALTILTSGGAMVQLVRKEDPSKLNPLEVRDGRFKVHPIFDWSDRDVYLYLKAHGLPYHPLWDKGYVSIGDWHSTKSLSEVDSAEELRFAGLKRECGIHGLEG